MVCPALSILYKRGVEEIDIKEKQYNGLPKGISHIELIFENMPNLKFIKIGKKCFEYINSFRLENLPCLESIAIGDDSLGSNENAGGQFSISKCPNLQSIKLGKNCFKYYSTFNISELPSLTSIHFGESCFQYCAEFELKGIILNSFDYDIGLPQLTLLQFDDNAFSYCRYSVVEGI